MEDVSKWHQPGGFLHRTDTSLKTIQRPSLEFGLISPLASLQGLNLEEIGGDDPRER
jgi:hypothetical protein